jgi:ABC-type amino acid transport substrate-binding protein
MQILEKEKEGRRITMKKKELSELLLVLALAFCLFLTLSNGSPAAAADQESALHRIQRTGVLRVGYALWFPWTYVDEKTKKLSGIGPGVIEELAKALGNVKIEWVADSWGTLPAGLQANKFDITYPLGVTLPRALACDFTDDTMREAQTFLIKKKDASRFKTFEDVNQTGVKVSVCLGTNTDMYLTRLFTKPEIVRIKSSPESLMALVLGKVDVWASTGSAIADAMKVHPDTTVVKGHFALGKNCMAIRQGDQIFFNWLNLFIADMKETGTMDRMFKKYGMKREVFFE